MLQCLGLAVSLAEDGARIYAALAGRCYDVCWAWMFDRVGTAKDFGFICVNVTLLICLIEGLPIECLYRFHEGWNVSEVSVERYVWALGFAHVE